LLVVLFEAMDQASQFAFALPVPISLRRTTDNGPLTTD
jgi:hypothetical protein